MPRLWKGRESVCGPREGSCPAGLTTGSSGTHPTARSAAPKRGVSSLHAFMAVIRVMANKNHHLHRPCGAVPPPKGNLSPGTPVLAQLSLCFVIQMLLGVADSIWSYMNENQSVTSHSSREGLMLATATV